MRADAIINKLKQAQTIAEMKHLEEAVTERGKVWRCQCGDEYVASSVRGAGNRVETVLRRVWPAGGEAPR